MPRRLALTLIDIRVRFTSDDRSLDALAALRIPTRSGNVPMGSFVSRKPAEATRTIMRTDMRRTMLVQADLEKGVLIEPVLDQVRAALPSLGLDPGVQLRFKGGAQDQKETASFLIVHSGSGFNDQGLSNLPVRASDVPAIFASRFPGLAQR